MRRSPAEIAALAGAENVERVGRIGGDAVYAPRSLRREEGGPLVAEHIGTADVCGVVVRGDYAYTVVGYRRQNAFHGGLHGVDVSDPAHPINVFYYDQPAEGVDVSGDIVYVAAGYSGLHMVEVSDPTSPTRISRYHPEVEYFEVKGVYIDEDIVYVAAGFNGLRIVDVSDPGNPTELGYCDTGGYACSVRVRDMKAYTVGPYEGVNIVDVSNPTDLNVVGGFNAPDVITDVDVSGSTAYVTAESKKLYVVDLSDLARPKILAAYYPPYRRRMGPATGVRVIGKTAYVSAGKRGLRVVDVSEPLPLNLPELGFYGTRGFAGGLCLSGGLVYMADGEAGLVVLRYTGPTP